MRHLILLIFTFALIGCSTSKPTGPSKKPQGESTGILLKVNKSPDEAFSKLVDYLKENEFKFQQIDRFEQYLRTEQRTLDEEMYTYMIEAVIPESDSTVIVFRGEAIGPRMQSAFRIRRNMGHLSNNIWDRFEEMVVGFPHAEVYYTNN